MSWRSTGRHDPTVNQCRRLRATLTALSVLLIAGMLIPANAAAASDTDRDGLPNAWERSMSATNPRHADTDRDGRPDRDEDPDRDGLTNRQEYLAGTHPRRRDTDRDGVPDAREDVDRDGLRNAFEFLAGTSPRRADSDRDGARDGRENPDQDGLSNAREATLRTNPRAADTDGDGVSDGAEVKAGTDPRKTTVSPTVGPTPAPAVSATPSSSASGYLFGTLLTDASRSAGEYAAGVRVVHLELGWDNYEPTDGVFNETYIAQMRQRLVTMRGAGMQVVLGAGLQYPPAWAYTYPDSRYVNQFGGTSRELNLTFNATLRAKAARYLARLDADFDLNSFWAVRIGAGGSIETVYPAHTAGGAASNAYWGFDTNAQASSPLPGWKPGQTTLNGRAVSTAQVETWYDWYVGALVGGVNWQLDVYRGLGFGGYLQVLMPGQGARPLDDQKAIGAYLNGSGDGNRTMSRGAAWHRALAKIANKTNVVAYVSSMADGSGWDDTCQATDGSVGLNAPAIGLWSAARWISYLADRHGLAKNGENPGRNDTNGYGTAMLARATAQMTSCGFQGLMWAHDAPLYDPTSGISLADYSTVIRAN